MWATDRHEVRSAAGRAAAFFAACAPAPALDRVADDPEDPVPVDVARGRVAPAGRADRPELISLDFAPAARTPEPAADAPAPAGPLPDITPAVATPATVPARATVAPAAAARPRGPGRRQRFARGSLPEPGWPGRLL